MRSTSNVMSQIFMWIIFAIALFIFVTLIYSQLDLPVKKQRFKPKDNV